MANRFVPPAPPMPQMVQVPMTRTPTATELADVAAVRALQVRTNALQFAIAALDRQAVKAEDLTALAGVFAAFLEGREAGEVRERYDIG